MLVGRVTVWVLSKMSLSVWVQSKIRCLLSTFCWGEGKKLCLLSTFGWGEGDRAQDRPLLHVCVHLIISTDF